jgi:hypothetical protein
LIFYLKEPDSKKVQKFFASFEKKIAKKIAYKKSMLMFSQREKDCFPMILLFVLIRIHLWTFLKIHMILFQMHFMMIMTLFFS